MTTAQTFIERARRNGAECDTVDGVQVLHLDKPDRKEWARRLEEVRGECWKEDDCPLCQAMPKPEAVIFDKDSMLCIGKQGNGVSVGAYPRKAAV